MVLVPEWSAFRTLESSTECCMISVWDLDHHRPASANWKTCELGAREAATATKPFARWIWGWSCFTMVKCNLAGVILIIVGFISDSPRKLPHTWEKSITGNPAGEFLEKPSWCCRFERTLRCGASIRIGAEHMYESSQDSECQIKARYLWTETKRWNFGQHQWLILDCRANSVRLAKQLWWGPRGMSIKKPLVSHGLLWRFFYEWILLKK